MRTDIITAYINKCKCKFMEVLERIFNNDENQIMYMGGEDWKPFGNYLVSSYGRIFSLKYNRMLVPILRKAHTQSYYWIRICGNKTYKDYPIHRLVAMLFIPNPEQKAQVHHKDCDPLNNRADNLQWVTQSEHTKIHQELRQKGSEQR